jgi:hypothetical protein
MESGVSAISLVVIISRLRLMKKAKVDSYELRKDEAS